MSDPQSQPEIAELLKRLCDLQEQSLTEGRKANEQMLANQMRAIQTQERTARLYRIVVVVAALAFAYLAFNIL